ncbi:hypothetical protein FHS21_002559 [Phyllobacterium trifolii]|uniref:Uncharacterized protein n=1 Tax=Phyllobacterium trifolii TaxID=300193 RepID=A0A839U832_9HYPH|nr:hypothetical protein [Phyllobacterium trifolii]
MGSASQGFIAEHLGSWLIDANQRHIRLPTSEPR